MRARYLDGEATPDERARVEADPSLLGEVERLRAVRVTLFDATQFEGPSDEVREAAIAAALGAWDVASRPSGARVETPPAARRSNVRTFERRHTYTRWLSAAAALVAVAALGVVVARSGGGGDNDESGTVAIEAPADTAAGDALVDTADEQTELSASTGNAERTASDDDAGADAGGAEPASETAEQAPAPAATEASEATTMVADAAPQENLSSPAELGAYALEAKRAAENDPNPDVLARPCSDDAFDDIDTYVAMVTYRDRSVLIGIDDEDDRAFAVDADTCEIVAEAPLP